MTVADRRARFRELHAQDGHLRHAERLGRGLGPAARRGAAFEALATTSAGFAWTLGRNDQSVTRDELVAHVARARGGHRPAALGRQRALLRAPTRPASPRRCACWPRPARPAARSRTTTPPPAGSTRSQRPPSGSRPPPRRPTRATPMVLTARAENHLHGVRRPGRHDRPARRLPGGGRRLRVRARPDRLRPTSRAVVAAVDAPVNVLALPDAPRCPSWAALGVRRVSTGSLLASAAYGAMLAGRPRAAGRGQLRLRPGRACPRDVRTAAF